MPGLLSATRSLIVLFVTALPLTSQAQTSADSGARLLERGRLALEGQTGESLRQALELGREAAAWFHEARRPGDEAEARRQIGVAHLQLGNSDSALTQLKQAQTLASADVPRQIEIANALGATYEQISEWSLALHSYREAYRVSIQQSARIQTARSLNNIGQAHYRLGNVDSALAIFGQAYQVARALPDTAIMAIALGNLGSVVEDIGRPDSALMLYRKSLTLRRGVHDVLGMVEMLNNIGLVHHNQTRLDSARFYYVDAVTTLTRARVQAPLYEALIKNSLGAVERALGRPAAALKYYNEALHSFRAAGDRHHAAVTTGNIGLVYSELERFDSAVANYRAVADTFGALKSPGDLLRALHNLGSIYQTLQKLDSAKAYFDRAFELANVQRDSSAQAYILGGLALVYWNRGERDTALAYAWRAYRLARRIGNQNVTAELTTIGKLHEEAGQADSARFYYQKAARTARKVKSPQGLRTALENLAILYHRGPQPNLRRALAYYDSATAVIGAFRTAAGSDLNRLSFSEGANPLFGVWALAWLDRVDVSARERALAALAATERGRAQALLDLVRRTRSEIRPGVDLIREGSELITGLRSPVLTFFATRDTLLIWLVEPSGALVAVRRQVARDTLARLVNTLSTSLRRKDADWLRPARELAQVLLPVEIVSRLPEQGELVVVPHGMLALTPFVILPAGPSATPLGARRAIRYAPSLEILRSVASRPDRRAAVGREHSLVVGNPTMPSFVDPAGVDIDLTPLPHTALEADSIASRLAAPTLKGASATEFEVRRQMPSAVVVHLATHGFAYSSDARTRESFVALASGENAGVLYDGHLTVGEVLEEVGPLRAELVALSACQTGLGNLKQAEGTIGLQRAFLARGARSVLVSLWSVPDEATRLLMQRFYVHWLGADRPSKAEALRRAQGEVKAKYPHPWFWAAFQLVGAQ